MRLLVIAPNKTPEAQKLTDEFKRLGEGADLIAFEPRDVNRFLSSGYFRAAVVHPACAPAYKSSANIKLPIAMESWETADGLGTASRPFIQKTFIHAAKLRDHTGLRSDMEGVRIGQGNTSISVAPYTSLKIGDQNITLTEEQGRLLSMLLLDAGQIIPFRALSQNVVMAAVASRSAEIVETYETLNRALAMNNSNYFIAQHDNGLQLSRVVPGPQAGLR